MSIALRPYLPADGRRCTAIFRAAIEASEDYSEAQREAWAALADDENHFTDTLASLLTLTAFIEGELVGFASLKGEGHIEMLYVDPEFAGQGVGTTLLDALEKIARGRGAKILSAIVSDNAKSLFEKLKFQSLQRSVKSVGEEWLGVTSMQKTWTKS